MQRYTYVRNLFNIQLAVKPDIYRCFCFQSDRLDFVCSDSDYFLRKDDRQADCPFSFRSSSSSVFPIFLFFPFALSFPLSVLFPFLSSSSSFFLSFSPPFSPPLYYISFHSVLPLPLYSYLSPPFLSPSILHIFPFR